MRTVRIVTSLIVMTFISGCGDRQHQPASRVEKDGLVVTFVPKCDGDEITLLATIENVGRGTQTIRSGSLPWQYDLLGSKFAAESSGRKLERNETAPMLGRTGPIDLQPGEQRSGVTPIGFMFPKIQSELAAGHDVDVPWKYTVSLNPPTVIEGEVRIRRDLCSR